MITITPDLIEIIKEDIKKELEKYPNENKKDIVARVLFYTFDISNKTEIEDLIEQFM